jgi:hypothetical protein
MFDLRAGLEAGLLGEISMDKVTQESSYKEIVTITLSGYQLIEARIKTYLHDYFEIVKYRIGNDLHFGFEGQDYSNAALGTLLKVFSKTCADSELLKDLRAEITHRDHVAHQALLVPYKRKPCSSEELSQLANELAKRSESIINLLNRLRKAHTDLVAPYKKDSADSD